MEEVEQDNTQQWEWKEHRESLQETVLQETAQEMQKHDVEVNYIKGFVQATDPITGSTVETLKKKIFDDYSSSVFIWQTGGNPPKRGAFGEAEIILKPASVHVKQRPYQMTGARRAA